MRDNLEKLSILEVASHYGEVKKAGREHVTICHFHDDRHPSLYMNEENDLGHCFSCGWGGDVFDFVMAVEGLDFKGALAHLGLDDQPRPTRAEITKRENLRRASRNLADWALTIDRQVWCEATPPQQIQPSETTRELLDKILPMF